jgi:hypothetical protein
MPDPHWSGRNDASPAENGHHVRGLTGQGRRLRAASHRPQAIRLLRFRLSGSNVERRLPDAVASPRSATRASCFAEPIVLPHQTLEAALADAAVAPDPSTTWRQRNVTRRRAESATRKMAGKPALCPSFPSCKKGLEGPDAVRTLATRHGILIGDGSVHAAGPMRGHGQSRLSDTCSDLVVPTGFEPVSSP